MRSGEGIGLNFLHTGVMTSILETTTIASVEVLWHRHWHRHWTPIFERVSATA